MMKDFNFWRRQIDSAKKEHKAWLDNCKQLGKLYTDKETRINMLFSNTQILKSALLNNDPRPEVSRRFFNSIESDKTKSDLYATTARVAAAAVEYYFSKNDATAKCKRAIQNEVIYGRGVIWVEYNPTIVAVHKAQTLINRIAVKMGLSAPIEEKIAGRDIKIISLKPDEYLCSFAENENDVWWRARRHLLGKNELKARFGYDAEDNELSYTDADDELNSTIETSRRRGEVWEIWDKVDKKRIFVLMTACTRQILEETPDPYKLSDFWPCQVGSFLTDENSIIPVPEYNIYSKLCDEINDLADKNALLETKIKYIRICANKNQDLVSKIETATDGAVIGDESFNSDNGVPVSVVDIKAATEMIANNAARINVLQNLIYQVTGLSDLFRGATDARETAEAQKIKGFYGGLRFRDRQQSVQNGVRHIFRIVAELICEHWDWETLSQISAVELMSREEKHVAQLNAKNGQQLPPTIIKQLQLPASDDVIELLRNDRMRNFVIDIESSATEFDDQAAQTAAVQKLTDVYLNALQVASKMASPDFIDGFIALVKMNLAPIKISSAISTQLVDSLLAISQKMRNAANNPPQPTPEDKKLQFEQNQAELKRKSDFELQAMKLRSERELKEQQMNIDAAYKDRELALREREIAVKEYEIRKEAEANAVRTAMGIAPDTNLG